MFLESYTMYSEAIALDLCKVNLLNKFAKPYHFKGNSLKKPDSRRAIFGLLWYDRIKPNQPDPQTPNQKADRGWKLFPKLKGP